MKVVDRSSSQSEQISARWLTIRKYLMTAALVIATSLWVFMATPKVPSSPQDGVAQGGSSVRLEPVSPGLSRQRKDFAKALDILAGAALNDTRLTKYHARVQERVRGGSPSPEAQSSVARHDPSQPVEQTELPKAAAGISVPISEQTPPAKVLRPTGLTVGDMEVETNPAIERWVSYYTASQGGRQTMQIGINRSGSYLNLARTEFQYAGVPQDLVWLAQVESVWHTTATSPAAAGGLWQFIPKTATDYGLTVSEEEDERLDPAKQTRVAALYLRDLYMIFGDWSLAMAAYNCGEPRVMNAIVKNGRPDFWEIHEKQLLPRETLNYVPKILAAIEVASRAENYGFWSDGGLEASSTADGE